ncbi:AMMECR1 domain-containing protein [Dehalococcoidia bacterium]|nr:AMMECR1 domain-containing protein [Dehalococcoidia bacterium]
MMPEDMHPIVELARKAVEKYVRDKGIAHPRKLTPEMKQKAGVFVSIHKRGQLRGCIGTFQATRPNVAPGNARC